MANPQWPDLWDLFEQAAELPADRRDAWLEDACAGDKSKKQRIVDLLAADALSCGLLDRPSGPPGPDAGLIPEQIGPYRVLRELGHGGMGQVFLGQREDDEFDRQVAIKLAPLGRYSESLLQRFVLERQILSDLHHPNIARLFDGGTTAEGVPYIIMEYVDGQPIDCYCQDQRLSLEARLALFIKVCGAVHHAHQQLIVHRDIKPGNVLVDRAGEPRLLDFGIAKLLDAGDGDSGPATRTQDRIATPEYAAPEQILGEPVSTATDVYSLGVLMFEMLTGARPFDGASSRPLEVETRQPLRPSAAATDSSAIRPKRLRGDLDNIVLMAMRREPSRRYDSAAALAQDIQRHLDGFPVHARPEAVAYRTGKLLRRHPIAAGATVLGFLALGAFSWSSYHQAQRLQTALDRAEVEQQKAEAVAGFLTDLFRAPDPLKARQQDLTLDDLLSAAPERIETELTGQPEVQVSLLQTLAEVHHNLSRMDEAETLAREAIRLSEENNGADHPLTLRALLALARIEHARQNFKKGVELNDRVLAALGNETDTPLLAAHAHLQRAASMTSLDRYADSISAAEKALALRIEHLGAGHPDVAQVHSTLGLNRWYQGDYATSLSHYETRHRILENALGPDHPSTIQALGSISALVVRTGDFERAETLYRAVLEKQLAMLGPDHSQTASTWNELGVTLLRQARYEEGEQALRTSVQAYRRIFGEQSADAKRPLGNLALLLTESQRYDEAIALYEELLERETAERGPDHWIVGSTWNNLGLAWQNLRQLEKAEAAFREAHRIIRTAWGESHHGLAFSLTNLGVVLHDQGRPDEAEPLFQQALRLRREGLGPDDPALATTLHEYGRFLADRGRVADAAPLLQEALEIRKKKLPENDWRTLHTRVVEADVRGRLDNPGEVLEPMRNDLELLTEKLGDTHWRVNDAKRRIAAVSDLADR